MIQYNNTETISRRVHKILNKKQDILIAFRDINKSCININWGISNKISRIEILTISGFQIFEYKIPENQYSISVNLPLIQTPCVIKSYSGNKWNLINV